MVLNICPLSDDALYLYQVSRKYLKGFHCYWGNAINTLKFAKGHNSVKNVDGVMVLILSISSDNV